MESTALAPRGRGTYVHAARVLSTPVGQALHHPKLIPAIIAAIVVVAAAWIGIALFRWRRISWRDHLDAPVDLVPRQAARAGGHWAAWKVFAQHQEVADPSLVLLRVRNTGFVSVSIDDIRRPITFTFPGREVKEFTVSDSHGIPREVIQPPGTAYSAINGNRITLPMFAMKRRDSFHLLVLLTGMDKGVIGRGRLRRGKVVRETRGRGRIARNIAFGAVLALLAGIQAGVTFAPDNAMPSSCGSGQLTLEGSTAFAPVAKQIGQEYKSMCRGVDISVSGIATFNGLNAVVSAGTDGRIAAATPQIAMSDGPAPSGYQALVGHPVAVIIFAVVVNRKAGVFNLTLSQLRGIFAGTITNWRQVNGANLPIRIVARVTGSGTRRAFDQKVLGQNEPPFSSYNCLSKDAAPGSPVIKCEVTDTGTLLQRVNDIAGAIGYAQISDAAAYPDVESVKLNGWDPQIGAVERGAYPYWTVEYLYTYGSPTPGTLASSFLNYLNTAAAKDTLRSAAYTPCVDGQVSLLTTLCAANPAGGA